MMQPRCQLLSARLAVSQSLFNAPSTSRAYATSVPAPIVVKNPLQRRKGGDLGSHLPKHVIPQDTYIPPYPYGDHTLFKQANRGLYGDQRIQFGNNVSHKTETKTRRYWKPNILTKSLYSVALKKKIKLRITSKVLKTMDREGGLDEYLLKDNEHRLKELGPLGWALRWALLQKPEVIDRMRFQAAELGLDQATIDAQWPTRQMQSQQRDPKEGYIRAGDLLTEEYEEVDADAEGEGLDTKAEIAVTRSARKEYSKVLNVAERYVERGLVDDQESGLKLAFIRAKERKEASARLKREFAAKLDNQFTPEHLEELRTRLNLPPTLSSAAVKKVAYNQWRRSEIEKAGSYETWRANQAAEHAWARNAKTHESGNAVDFAESRADRKAMYANLIQEAEAAINNLTITAEERAYQQTAIMKASRAIKATARGGADDYANMMLAEFRASRPSTSGAGKTNTSTAENEAGGDAWAVLANSSASKENRPQA